MALQVSRYIRNGPKSLGLVLMLLLLVPAAAWATPGSTTCVTGEVCLTNVGGTAYGSVTGGLIMNGSKIGTTQTVLSTINQLGNMVGTDLGTISFTTGAFTGNLGTSGTFAPGTFTITNNTPYNGFTGTLFSGTFGSSSIPITWSLTQHVKGSADYFYTLSGPVSGTWYTGLQVSGATTQLFFESKGHPYAGGAISLTGGSTSIVVPEPGSLALMGTGLLGVGLTIRQRVRGRQGKQVS
jgi:hypothetical protein